MGVGASGPGPSPAWGRSPRQLPGGRLGSRRREQVGVSRLAVCRPAPARVQTPWAVEVLLLPATAAAPRANAPPFAWSAASRKLLPGGVPDPNASAVLR